MKNKLLVYFLFLSIPSGATHLHCGYISVESVSSIPRVCLITITVFTEVGSQLYFGGPQDKLDFGDATSVFVPETPSFPRPDLGTAVGVANYSILHTYANPGNYTVSYQESNRDGGIINMDNSIGTPFFLETNFSLDPFYGLFDSPEFLVGPFFSAKLGTELSLSVSAIQKEGFVIQYAITTPALATNYKLPENFKINPINGVITWDTKFHDQYIAGEYLFAVKVHLFKKIDNSMHLVCTVIRDFQIVLSGDGTGGKISDNKVLDDTNRIYIPENESFQLKIFYESTSPTGLEAFSQLMDENEFSFTTYDSSTNENIKVGVLALTNHANIIRDSPYQITVRGKSDPFASDVAYLFYTKDLFPEIITRTEDEISDVELFPNPVKDYVSISIPENQQGRIIIYNQTGIMIFDGFIQENTPIDLRSVPSGFYFCRVQFGNRYKLIRLFKL